MCHLLAAPAECVKNGIGADPAVLEIGERVLLILGDVHLPQELVEGVLGNGSEIVFVSNKSL